MPAIPALIMAGGAIGSTYMAGRSANSATKTAAARSPEEQQLLQQQTGQAREMFGAGMPAVKNTLQYYQTLLSGSRGARQALAAPEAEDTVQAYQGADRAIMNGHLQGGERDQALAENSRAKAGQIARLVTGRRGEGAAGAASLAAPLVGAGSGASSALLANMTQNRQQANQIGLGAGQGTAQAFGALLAQLSSMYGKRGAGGGAGTGAPNNTWGDS